MYITFLISLLLFLRFSVGFCGAAISQGAKLHPAKPKNQSPQKSWTRTLTRFLVRRIIYFTTVDKHGNQMGDFEWALVKALNSFFEENSINAIAYRLKQSRLRCPVGGHPSGLENTRVLPGHRVQELGCTQNKIALFQAAFQLGCRGTSNGTRDGFYHPLGKTGHSGRGASPRRGKSRAAHLVPWGQVFQSYDMGKTGITLQEIEINPPLERKGGAYEISRWTLCASPDTMTSQQKAIPLRRIFLQMKNEKNKFT